MNRCPLRSGSSAHLALWDALQAHDEVGVRRALAQGATPSPRLPDHPSRWAVEVLAQDHLDRVVDWARVRQLRALQRQEQLAERPAAPVRPRRRA